MSEEPLDPELRFAVTRVARVPVLLIACDYDGTLAPIVEDPTKAVPLREAVAAVRALAARPEITATVVCGWALRDLAVLSRLPDEVQLVGSHGSEFDLDFVDALEPQAQQLHTELRDTLQALARRRSGVRLEVKPASVAVHLRAAEPGVKQVVLDAVRTGPATWPGVVVTHGKEVIELSVISTHKGTAVDALRARVGASAAVFIGDDITDENAFAHLHGPDVGIKIGPGETRARHRVDGPYEAARVLALLLEHRQQWLFGERSIPIERHSMLANGRTVALVTPDARISWLCHPRPDSGALFADLLGDSAAGHFTIRPEHAGKPLGQRYRPNTMTVDTRWSGVTVTDWLDMHPQPQGAQQASYTSTLVRVVTGSGKVRVEFAPRPEFGQLPIRLQPLAGDGLLVLGSNERTALAGVGRAAGPALDGRRRRAAERAGAARAVVRADRRDHRRRHHIPARADRRRPELGLPVLLAARLLDDRAGAGRARLAGGGRGAAGLGGPRRRVDRRAPGAAQPALRGGRLGDRRRGGHRHPARLRRLPAGTGRQPRQEPAAARRVRFGGRPARRGVRAARSTARGCRADGGDGRRGGAALARAGLRRVGVPPPARTPRVLQGDVLAHRRPGASGLHPAGRAGAPRLARAARDDREQRAGPRLERRGGRLHEGVRPDPARRGVAVDRAVRAARRRRPAVPGDRAEDRGRLAQRADGVPVPAHRRLGRRPAGPRGRLPSVHRLVDRGVPAHRPAGRRRGAVRPDARLRRAHRTAPGAVRPGGGAGPG